MFTINKNVFFNEEDGSLENQMLGVSVLLAASSSRLLFMLISYHGNPVERDVLLKSVWDDNGLRSSNSNLNQYISILRKQLSQVGLPDDAIITLPKLGFMFNQNVDVIKKTSTSSLDKHLEKKLINKKHVNLLYYMVFSICTAFLCAVLYVFYSPHDDIAPINPVIITNHNGCDVYSLSGSHSIGKSLSGVFKNLTCDENTVFFISGQVGEKKEKLIASCKVMAPGYFSHCENRVEE